MILSRLALGPLGIAAALLVACNGEPVSNQAGGGTGATNGTGAVGATGGVGGSGGVGGTAGAGGAGGAACAAGGGAGAGATCPGEADVGQAYLASLDVPGLGRVWPRPAVLDGGEGGAGGTGEPGSGCTAESDPHSDDPLVECHGLAKLQWVVGEYGGELQVTYGDGSVARVSTEMAPPVTEAELDISVSTYWNPDDGASDDEEVSGRTTNGAELWIHEYHLSLVDAALLFGAPVTEVESCPAEHAFEHIVHSTPEQRIPVGEVATIRGASGTYRVAWNRRKPEPTACKPNVYESDSFTAALIAE